MRKLFNKMVANIKENITQNTSDEGMGTLEMIILIIVLVIVAGVASMFIRNLVSKGTDKIDDEFGNIS